MTAPSRDLAEGSLPPLVEPTAELTPAELVRYDRHLLLPQIGLVGQRRLKSARVLVVGAGGLGSPALAYLAAAGVGVLGIVDDDRVEVSNLQRQIVHGQSDVGRHKVDSAVDSVAEWNPHVEVRAHRERLTRDNALELVGQYDLVLDGTDNFATRYLVNDACALVGVPYVWGSIFRFDGQVSVFWAGHGPCYRCLFPEPPPPGMVPSCAEGGVLGVLCAAVGSAQVAEAVKLITGAGRSLVGRLQVHDALAASWHTLEVAADPDCPLCGSAPTITELQDYQELCGLPAATPAPVPTLDAAELRRWLAERERGERDFVLVDVREPAEREVSRIEGSVLVPKATIDSGAGLSELPADRTVVLYCRSGARSEASLRRLQEAGWTDVHHLAGGLLGYDA
ncbi:molybdopterin-synthase adenylyltransferase MoeB [Desertihabitans brevis]|uniref:Molybdopterin-synthase adenylyltransferase MoeB n=1 Tax=Desertihabitans brevis TaxID=2268447 RepID=A0A367YYM1_9ACTN|nr:molybdopterin-synthase adenylyltransferase MoeB [Desertihabitans brevis]RCK70944.1 molybdopterin-synthase adenylyltransferase MoeB [Desertihabitans brevis]